MGEDVSNGSSPKRQRRDPGSGMLQVSVLGGASNVSLPLSLVLAEHGHSVVLVEKDATLLSGLRAGQFPYLEEGGPELLKRCFAEFPERLAFSSELSAVRGCDVVIVTTSTPVDNHLNPDLSEVEACVGELCAFLSGGESLVLRSTTLAPGTAESVQSILRRKGLDVSIGFCPDRLATGRAVQELTTIPQIVSGSDARALAHAQALFKPLGVDLVELSVLEAEIATLFLNAWRYVAFGTANQFYQMAVSKGLDFVKIRAAITHKYQRSSGFPSAGFTAGPRLLQDTMQLAAYCRHTFSLGHAAMLVNETMPDCILEQARKEQGLLFSCFGSVAILAQVLSTRSSGSSYSVGGGGA
ncbi:unnamed protein product [Polarella glacialis]|uniref:UDP-glucose/GDP-mannose dehydrogenase N-terminal domain-containing protein n=1 Tax=Polarella glacialis TaxID=89957 RepID=A0A813CZK4_POLGL|nr:unnamed protein product [Polarella glacialis]